MKSLLFAVSLFASLAFAKPLPIQIASFPGKVKVLVDLSTNSTVSNNVDILFVVDNSGSMSAQQQAMISRADIFIDKLVKSGTDWKIGVITTSVAKIPYVGFEPGNELTSQTPNAADVFKTTIRRLGTSGDGTERVFEPVLNVLNKYPKFLRTSSTLVIAVISDAPEQSALSAKDFVLQLSKLTGDMSRVLFQGFLNPTDWCQATDDSWNWPGSKYEQLLTMVPGTAYKLCDPNFADVMANMVALFPKAGTPVIRRIPLPSTPDLDSIVVNYGSQVITKGALSTGWIFSEPTNEVVLGDKIQWSAQPPKTMLEITYVPADWK